MKSGLTCWIAIVALNLVLAAGAALLAPADIGTTADRVGYEYVGQHPLEPNCAYSIFCYRVLVPTILEHVPLPHVVSWRAFAIAANALSGLLLAQVAVTAGAGGPGALLASIMFQTSFGATFAIFDPFTPDPAVYFAAALLALCWLRGWPVFALTTGVIGVFAKETVALVTATNALAAWLCRPACQRRAWMLNALMAAFVLLGFHFMMDVGVGWSEGGSASADLLGGAFLVRWLTDPTLSASTRLLYVFIPFGFAWIFAVLGVRYAPDRLRALALAALIMLAPLVYVQTVERALATASFVVVPLAALYLVAPSTSGRGRGVRVIALAAAVANGLLTARVGLSTTWLPPVPYSLILAGTLAAVTILRAWSGSRAASSVPVPSSFRATSTK